MLFHLLYALLGSPPPSGGRAGLQLFTMKIQTKNQKKMTYIDNSPSCFVSNQIGIKFGMIVLQVNVHRCMESNSDMTSYFQDASHDVRKVCHMTCCCDINIIYCQPVCDATARWNRNKCHVSILWLICVLWFSVASFYGCCHLCLETESGDGALSDTAVRQSYIQQKLENGLLKIWLDIQQKVKTYLLSTDLSSFKYDSFIQVLDIVNRWDICLRFPVFI